MNRLHGMILCGVALIATAACAPQTTAPTAATSPTEATAPARPVAAESAPARATAPTEAAMTKASSASADGTLTSPSAWTLADGGRAELKTAAASEITLAIADGQISGYGGCNQYNASIAIDGDTVTIGPVAATKRGCPGDAGATEQAYFAALGSANAARIDGDTLELQLADGGTLRFARAAITP